MCAPVLNTRQVPWKALFTIMLQVAATQCEMKMERNLIIHSLPKALHVWKTHNEASLAKEK